MFSVFQTMKLILWPVYNIHAYSNSAYLKSIYLENNMHNIFNYAMLSIINFKIIL
jgi:hypothetical protein